MARPANTTGCTECGAKYYARGLCRSHYQKKVRRTFPSRQASGEVGNGRPMADTVEYRAAHLRVEKTRGAARSYFCIDCENTQAAEWSLKADASAVLTSNDKYSFGKAYSLNLEDYEPRCRPCHRLHDGWTQDPEHVGMYRADAS